MVRRCTSSLRSWCATRARARHPRSTEPTHRHDQVRVTPRTRRHGTGPVLGLGALFDPSRRDGHRQEHLGGEGRRRRESWLLRRPRNTTPVPHASPAPRRRLAGTNSSSPTSRPARAPLLTPGRHQRRRGDEYASDITHASSGQACPWPSARRGSRLWSGSLVLSKTATGVVLRTTAKTVTTTRRPPPRRRPRLSRAEAYRLRDPGQAIAPLGTRSAPDRLTPLATTKGYRYTTRVLRLLDPRHRTDGSASCALPARYATSRVREGPTTDAARSRQASGGPDPARDTARRRWARRLTSQGLWSREVTGLPLHGLVGVVRSPARRATPSPRGPGTPASASSRWCPSTTRRSTRCSLRRCRRRRSGARHSDEAFRPPSGRNASSSSADCQASASSAALTRRCDHDLVVHPKNCARCSCGSHSSAALHVGDRIVSRSSLAMSTRRASLVLGGDMPPVRRPVTSPFEGSATAAAAGSRGIRATGSGRPLRAGTS